MNIETLLKTNVNEHTEKKANLTYLSWAWAWAEALKADPKVSYKVEMFGDKCYMDIHGTCMVWVTVTMFEKAMTCQLPVIKWIIATKPYQALMPSKSIPPLCAV